MSLRGLDEDIGGCEVAVDDVVLVEHGHGFPNLRRQGLEDGLVGGGLALVPHLLDEVATRLGIFQVFGNQESSVEVGEVNRRCPDADKLAPERRFSVRIVCAREL